MAAQEITLRFRGDPSQLKDVLSDVRSSYGRTITEIVTLSKDVTSQMNAMWTQRGREVSAALAKELEIERAYASQEVQSATQTQRQIVATYRQREREAAAIAKSEATAWAQHENAKLSATRQAERQGQSIVSESNKAKERSAKQGEDVRRQATRIALADIARLERERLRIVTQNERAIASLAKTTADARVREGRRASNAIVASLREEAREVQRIQQAQFAPARGGGGAFLAGAAGGLTALVGVSVVSEIRQAASAWIDYASKLETTKIAFTTMLGSAQAAQDHLNELQQFALKTPFQFGELIDASQRMQALGFNAQQVVPLLTDVGNAVAAAGGGSERLDRVVLALSQMQSKGRVATQELNQLAEAGINGFKILELQTGKSRAELVKMVEQGQVSAAVFLEAFQKFSQQNFGGLMEQQSKTFTGAMSNIKDALLQTSATAFQPLYDRLNELAKQMADTSTKSNEFKENMAIVGRELARVWDGAIEAGYLLRDTYRVLFAAILAPIATTTHAVLALVRAFEAFYNINLAVSALMTGDLLTALKRSEAAERAIKLSVDEMTQAARAQSEPILQLGRAYTDASLRFEDAAARMKANARDFFRPETNLAPGTQIPFSVKPFSFAAPPRQPSTSTPTNEPPPTSTVQGERRSTRDAEAERALREEQAREDVNNRLIDQYNKLQDELRGVRTETNAYAIEQNILNGILADATPQLQALARENAKLVDNSTTQLRLQKELHAFLVQQAEDVRLVIEGEKSHLRIAQDLIANLERQGAVLQESTKFWLQHRATILDASEAYEKLVDSMDRHRQAVIDSIVVPAVAPAPENVPIEGIGEPPLPTEALTLFGELMDSIQQKMVGFTDFIHGTLIGAFHAMAQGVGEAIAAWALYGESIGKALRKALASILAQIAAEAAIQALLHAAYAIGRAAFGDFAGAAKHAIAAVKFGAVAVAAGVGARIVAGQAFQSASGGGAGSGNGGGAGREGSTAPSQPQPVEVDRRSGAPQVITNVIEYKVKGGVIVDEVVNDYLLNGRTRIIIRSDGQG